MVDISQKESHLFIPEKKYIIFNCASCLHCRNNMLAAADHPARPFLCFAELSAVGPVMNGGSAVNEKKSTGKHKAPNAQPYWLLTGANNISISTYRDQSYISTSNDTGSALQ